MSSSLFPLIPPLPIPSHTPVSKGLTTYDYIVCEREKDKEDSATGVERGFHGRCACLRRKVSRILDNLLTLHALITWK